MQYINLTYGPAHAGALKAVPQKVRSAITHDGALDIHSIAESRHPGVWFAVLIEKGRKRWAAAAVKADPDGHVRGCTLDPAYRDDLETFRRLVYDLANVQHAIEQEALARTRRAEVNCCTTG